MTVTMITTQRHRYGGRTREIGDTYEVVGETHAKLVTALRWAQRAQEEVSAEEPVKPKRAYTRKYQRRDLVAEE